MNQQTHVRGEPGFPFVIRLLWFFLVGWHVTLWWVLIAWFFNVTILGLPLGLWMLDRVPLILTLRLQRSYTVTRLSDGRIVESWYQNVPQHPWLVRAIYFVLIGWWFSLIWSLLAWLFCLTIILLPVGVLMLNRLPAVTTLMTH
jgi:uncharacterized membrane protein YccF (DUF307 family)